MRELIYKQTPQGDLRLRIYNSETSGENRRAIVFYFGGGWNGGNLDQFKPHSEHLAKHGMVAICAEYRVRSRHETTPIACVEDGRSAFRWVKSHADELGIDPSRIVSAGGSAGGHVALCVSLADSVNAQEDDTSIDCDPSLLVLFNPVCDVSTRSDRLESEAQALSISPIHLLGSRIQPSVMCYGSEDRMIEEGRAFRGKSTTLGVESELYVADGQKHAFFNKQPWLDSGIQMVHAFLEKHGYLEGNSGISISPTAVMHPDIVEPASAT